MASKSLYSKWVSGNLYFYTASGSEICHFDGANRKLVLPSGATLDISAATSIFGAGAVLSIRTRSTVAAVNAGATLLAAVAGLKYRMVGCLAIAIGGAAGAVTTVDILGTQSTAVKLVAFAQASLTQNTVCRDGSADGAVLAAGASYVPNDANTAITIGKTGSSVTTATHIDTILSYALEP